MLLFLLLEVVPQMSHDYSLESWLQFLVVCIPRFLHCIFTVFKVQILIEDLPVLKHRGYVLPNPNVLNLN